MYNDPVQKLQMGNLNIREITSFYIYSHLEGHIPRYIIILMIFVHWTVHGFIVFLAIQSLQVKSPCTGGRYENRIIYCVKRIGKIKQKSNKKNKIMYSKYTWFIIKSR